MTTENNLSDLSLPPTHVVTGSHDYTHDHNTIMDLIHYDVTEVKWQCYLGDICIETVEALNELVSSDSCERLNLEGKAIIQVVSL